MSLSKLSIFSKDTDAAETVKGYEYQKLRTLETWLQSYTERKNEIIYCDYEEDIFLRNLDSWTSKFVQLKLYSSKNFSFDSVEVKKAISHFFMLFVKGEYKFDEIQFVFETNVSVAGKYGNNDAELLKEWKDNQDAMSEDLLKRCAAKVKSMVSEYVKPFGEKVKDEVLAKEIEDAKIIVGELPDGVWEDFVKSIKWDFASVDADAAVQSVIDNCLKLIEATGFASAKADKESVFASLYYQVSERSTDADPGKRLLDARLLDSVLLSVGDKDDKWYEQNYKAWHEVDKIDYFLASEFYQILHAANYCRLTKYLAHHAPMWTALLQQYIDLAATPQIFRRKAVYELLWLNFPVRRFNAPDGNLIGYEEMIRTYYDSIGDYQEHEQIEGAVNLLGVVKAAIAFKKVDIELSEVETWEGKLEEMVSQGLKANQDANQSCYFHELAAGLLMQRAMKADENTINQLFDHFKSIAAQADKANMYDVVRLGNRIDAYIKLMIHHHADISLIERLEDFSDELMPLVNKLNGNFSTAKLYSERGFKYLQSKEPKSILRSLNYFHRAKELYKNDGTMEGYILALLAISQLYSATDNNYAAKYYALSAVWQSTQQTELQKRISDGFGLILHYDFDQGNWFNCIEVFRLYIRSRVDFKDPVIDVTKDELLMKSFVIISSILSVLPKILTDGLQVVESTIAQMGNLYEEELKHLKEKADEMVGENPKDFINVKCCDAVVNDAGEKRIIQWKALGTTWKVTFDNKWIETSLGEEIAAALQIILLQFAVAKNDIHFLKGEVTIIVEPSDRHKMPEQLPSNDSYSWKIFSRPVLDPTPENIRLQASYLTIYLKFILDELSLLPEADFEAEFTRFFEEEDLAGKTLPGYLYQRLYRNLFVQEGFEDPDRAQFLGEKIYPEIVESPALAWEGNISSKYSIEKSLELIKGRYKNVEKQIYLTLENIKKDPRYNQFIQQLREKGWLDWQIVLAMYNHILNYKTQGYVRQRDFSSEKEFEKRFQEVFWELGKVDEQQTYVEFPLDFFMDKHFEFQLNNVLVLILRRWELENKSRFPNFNSLRQFLNDRFNFGQDDLPEESPL